MGLGSFIRKIPRAVVKPLDQLARSERVDKAVQVGAGTATSFIPGIQVARGLQTRSLKGAFRGIAGSVPGANVALLAYDAKRLRQKTKAASRKYRVIRKQALADGDAIQERLNSYAGPGSLPIGPLYDRIAPPPDINLGPSRSLGAGELDGSTDDMMAYLSPGAFPAGAPDTLEAPTPDARGQGGDAREGVRAQIAGPGKGIALFLVAGLILAALAAYKRAS